MGSASRRWSGPSGLEESGEARPPPPPITQRDDGVLIRGDALPLMYRACLALVARRHRDGLAASPLLQQARTTFYRATMSSHRHEDDTHTLAESRSDRQRLELRSVGRLPCDNRVVQGNARLEQSSDPPPRKAIRGMSWFNPAPEPVSRTPPHADERSLRRRLLGTVADPSWWIRDIVVALLIALLVLVGQKWVDDSRAVRDRAIAADQNRQAQRLENLRFVRDRSSRGDQDQPRPFAGLDLADMNLAGLYLRGADFSAADLEGAKLNLTDLSAPAPEPKPGPGTPNAPGPFGGLSFPSGSPTDFTGANLCSADLTGANLQGANLTRANLSGADLLVTDLSETTLVGADLTNTQLGQGSMVGVDYDSSTIWPDGFTPPPKAPKTPMQEAAEAAGAELGRLRNAIPRPDCD
jgi:uncharacterized protein YjbI with pentapeptide repeats